MNVRELMSLLRRFMNNEQNQALKRLGSEYATEDTFGKCRDEDLAQPFTELMRQFPSPDMLAAILSDDFQDHQGEHSADVVSRIRAGGWGLPHNSDKLHIVQQESPRLVNQIFDDWEELTGIVSHHSETLNRRWMKRTIDKRKKLLLEAWPNMSPQHRPDFHAYRHQLQGPVYRDAWLMPYMNLEDLSAQKNLLYFLDSRVARGPEHFAWSDFVPTKTAVSANAIDLQEFNATGYTMRFSGQRTRATYGSLVAWKDDPYAVEDIVLNHGYTLGEGLSLLETQKKIYHFLLQCTRILLQDINLAAAASSNSVNLSRHLKPLEQSNTAPSAANWLSISEKNAERAYHLPELCELSSLCNLAAAKRDEAEDIFWALHEDPVYFREELEDLLQREMIICHEIARRKSFRVKKIDEVHQLQKCCKSIILKSCRNLIIWHTVWKSLKDLEDIKSKLPEGLQSSKRMPPVYREALATFASLMHYVTSFPMMDLGNAIATTPIFLRYSKIDHEKSGDTQIQLAKNANHPPILRLLLELSDGELIIKFGAMNILDEIERTARTDPSQGAMVNKTMSENLAELAAHAQIHQAMIVHQPRIPFRQDHDPDGHRIQERINPIEAISKQIEGINLTEYVTPASSFVYPADTKFTPGNVEKRRIAESKLDIFWTKVDQHFGGTGKTLLQWMEDYTSPREIQRTQPWQPREEPLLERTGPVLTKLPSEKHVSLPEPASDKVAKLSAQLKVKPKTRGQASTSDEIFVPEPAKAVLDPDMPVQIIPLTSRAFKTMSALFSGSNKENSRRIVWKDFLHAMQQSKFEIQKRHGSEWYFEPIWHRSAPFTMHEPHPSHELRPHVLAFTGRRLMRRYGWTMETFKLV